MTRIKFPIISQSAKNRPADGYLLLHTVKDRAAPGNARNDAKDCLLLRRNFKKKWLTQMLVEPIGIEPPPDEPAKF